MTPGADAIVGNQPGADRLAEIRAVAERIATSCGLTVFDVQYRRESIGWVVRVFIDRPEAGGVPRAGIGEPDGVTIDDCRRVSGDLSAVLDVEDLVDHAYTLEVSSPGLDRRLRNAADFRRFTGRRAKIVAAEAIDGQKNFAGRLEGLEEDAVLLADDQGRVKRIPLPLITKARLEVEF